MRSTLQEERKPDLGDFGQHRENQKSLLDCFAGYLKPETSLCFFYAKQVPFVEDTADARILIGAGRVLHVTPAQEYRYKTRALTGTRTDRSRRHRKAPQREALLISGDASSPPCEVGGQCVSTILATACVGQNIARHLGQTEYVVEFAISQQPSIGGHHRAAKLEHQAAVEIQPNSIRSRFTSWVRHGRPDRSRISC